MSVKEGEVPADFQVTLPERGPDLEIILEFVGAQVVMPRGGVVPPGSPVPIVYRVFEPAVDWTVKYWGFDAATDPVQWPQAFAGKLTTPPAKTEILPRLDFVTGGAITDGLQIDRIALRAEGIVTLASGIYELAVISDDGVRVWIDDHLVIDRWNVHESAVDRLPLTGGRYRVRVEYFDLTGWAELSVRFSKR